MNNITDLLDLEDEDLIVSSTLIEGTTKILTIETTLVPHYCPCCSCKMHSRGIRLRKVSHPILQDGYSLILNIKQRRWKCTNEACCYEANDEFRFVNKRRRSTNATDWLIVSAFRDLSVSAADIARRFKTSDTHVLSVFDRYVRLQRLPLTEIVSVDEVFTDMADDCKYALVIQDFKTGDPIDILRSRRTKITEPYFAAIPIEERCRVKYLLSDMYNPYLSFVDKYFPNAVAVVDSFHVIQWVTNAIDRYIRSLEKHYRQRDRELEAKRSAVAGRPISLPESDEIYMLRKYRWLVLMNQSSITYHVDLRIDRHFRYCMNTYDYESKLFSIDPRLRTLRDLKEQYVRFNARNAGQPSVAAEELEDLITDYHYSGDGIFVSFARLLTKYKEPIINSFVMAEKYGPGGLYTSRLSKGPIESMNRKLKDLKRLGRGYNNFEHFRNRFLYATRNNPILDATGDDDQVQYYEEENE